MNLYQITDALLLIVLILYILLILGVLTRRIRLFRAESLVGERVVTEYIVAICPGKQVRFEVTEWGVEEEVRPHA
jgi:uncharacterized iron-regulated protein